MSKQGEGVLVLYSTKWSIKNERRNSILNEFARAYKLFTYSRGGYDGKTDTSIKLNLVDAARRVGVCSSARESSALYSVRVCVRGRKFSYTR